MSAKCEEGSGRPWDVSHISSVHALPRTVPPPRRHNRNKLLTAAGMAEGYTLKDLMKPDRARVQKALSGIINLQKFKESVQDDYNALVQKSVRAGGTEVASRPTSRVSQQPVHPRTASLRPAQLDLMEERRAVDEETDALRLELANVR